MTPNSYSDLLDSTPEPSLVRAVRILLWVAGGLTFITAADVWFLVGGSYGFGAAIVLVPPAVASLVAARRTLEPRHRTWSWIVFLQVFYLLWQLSRIPQGDPFAVLGLAFPVAILVCGTRPAARRYFRSEGRTRSRPGRTARLSNGDRGASLVSYLAVVLLVATVSVALMASHLPVQVSSGIQTAVCRITGDDHCDPIETADKGRGVQTATSNADGGTAPPAPSATAPKGDDGDSPDCLLHIGWYCEANDGLVQGTQTAVSDVGHTIGFVTCLTGVCGGGHAAKNWSSAGKGLGHLFTTNPWTTTKDIWNGTTKPIRDDWNSGHKARAVGRTLPTIAGIVFGGKGLGQLRKVMAAEKAAKKAEEAEKAAKAAKAAAEAATETATKAATKAANRAHRAALVGDSSAAEEAAEEASRQAKVAEDAADKSPTQRNKGVAAQARAVAASAYLAFIEAKARKLASGTKAGQAALEIIKKYNIKVIFNDTGGTYYLPGSDTIVVGVAEKVDPNLPPSLSHKGQRSDATLAGYLVHEAKHVQRDKEGLGPNIDDPKAEYVIESIDDEVEAMLAEIDAGNEFASMSISVDNGWLTVYNDAFRKATAGKYPELSTAKRDAIGREAGRAAVRDRYMNDSGVKRSGTDETYPETFGDQWEKAHSKPPAE